MRSDFSSLEICFDNFSVWELDPNRAAFDHIKGLVRMLMPFISFAWLNRELYQTYRFILKQ